MSFNTPEVYSNFQQEVFTQMTFHTKKCIAIAAKNIEQMPLHSDFHQ